MDPENEVVETEVAEVKDENVESQTEVETEAEEKPDKTKVQERIDELTRLRRQAERDAEYWRSQAQKPPEKEVEAEKPKTLADFDYDEGQYQTYLREQFRKDAVTEARRVLEEGRTQEHIREMELSYRDREHAFAKEVKDYKEVAHNPTLTVNDTMKSILMGMESGPSVLYYLGKNPEIADRLALLPSTRAAVEMGRIEARLEKEKGKSVSNAPPPPPKIEGSDSSQSVKADTPDSDKLSTEEWLKRRNKQVRSR